MPSNAKLARRAEQAKKVDEGQLQAKRDRASEMLVDTQIIPPTIQHLNKSDFSPRERAVLLAEFQEKAYQYFKAQKDTTGKRQVQIKTTETGIILTDGTKILFGAWVKKEKTFIINKKKELEKLTNTLTDRQKSRKETFFFYHRGMETTMWGTNEELTEQMKEWRQMRQQNTLTIDEENLREFELEGRTYYTLVITGLENGEAEQVGLDRLGFGVGYVVDGYIYWFVKKENRDATYKYVMGIK